VIGPWAIRSMLYREAKRTAAGLEQVARHAAGWSARGTNGDRPPLQL
jgi:hypothetical protein